MNRWFFHSSVSVFVAAIMILTAVIPAQARITRVDFATMQPIYKKAVSKETGWLKTGGNKIVLKDWSVSNISKEVSFDADIDTFEISCDRPDIVGFILGADASGKVLVTMNLVAPSKVTKITTVVISATCGEKNAQMSVRIIPVGMEDSLANTPGGASNIAPVKAHMSSIKKKRHYAIALSGEQNAEYELFVSKASQLMQGVYISLDNGASFTYYPEEAHVRANSSVDNILIDFSETNISAGDNITFNVTDNFGKSTTFSASVLNSDAEYENVDMKFLTIGKSFSLEFSSPNEIEYSCEMLNNSGVAVNAENLNIVKNSGKLAVSLQATRPPAGSYDLKIYRRVGEIKVLWAQIPFHIAYPLF